MSRPIDPPRWTVHPRAAPDVLRDAFAAASDEGPSAAQLGSLAVRLTAISTGSAVVATASKAAAANAGGGNAAAAQLAKVAAAKATAGTGLAALKTAVSVAALVAGTSSAVVWYQSSRGATPATSSETAASREIARTTPARSDQAPLRARSPRSVAAAPASRASSPHVTPLPVHDESDTRGAASASTVGSTRSVAAARAESRRASKSIRAKVRRAKKIARRQRAERAREAQRRATARRAFAVQVGAEPVVRSEITLLRDARRALNVSPARSLALTKQHRALYPDGAFAQERDALEIQALLRSGFDAKARDLAQDFVDAHPGSPLTHQLKESLDLP